MNNISEEKLIDWLKFYVNFGDIVNDDFPTKGACSWYPYGYSLMKNILHLASNILIKKAKFKEIVLPSFVHGEDFMKECKNIKDFSERVYWSPLYRKDDLHVVTPTIEAQLGALYNKWLQANKKLPFKYFTIRGVGRYETGRTIPLWKERNVWPFFEGLTVHSSSSDFLATIKQQINFMEVFFEELGIPVLILERPKINSRLCEYSERRIEAVTITKDKRVVILANIYDLGEIFSRVYDIFYIVKNTKYYALTSAIGLSGRVLATLLTINGDKDGFILSPMIAPIKLAILPIYNKPAFTKLAKKIEVYLSKKGIVSKNFPAVSSLGERRRKVTAMGIPFLIEIGSNEIKSSSVLIKERVLTHNSTECEIKEIPYIIKKRGKIMNKFIKQKAFKEFNLLTKSVKLKKNFLYCLKDEILTESFFCNNPNCYNKMAELSNREIIGRNYKAKINKKSKCIVCGKTASQGIYFGIKWKGEK